MKPLKSIPLMLLGILVLSSCSSFTDTADAIREKNEQKVQQDIESTINRLGGDAETNSTYNFGADL